jgi:SOS-response transcriptional repressor LexA
MGGCKKITYKNFGVGMTPAQREIYLVIDEWWKRFGFGPSIDDVMGLTGQKGRGNVSRKMWALVELGVCKGIKRRARSIRPSNLRVHTIE